MGGQEKAKDIEEEVVETRRSLRSFIDMSQIYQVASKILIEPESKFEQAITQLINKTPNLYALLIESIVQLIYITEGCLEDEESADGFVENIAGNIGTGWSAKGSKAGGSDRNQGSDLKDEQIN